MCEESLTVLHRQGAPSMPSGRDEPVGAAMPASIRKRFIVRGRVQRVENRDEVRELARVRHHRIREEPQERGSRGRPRGRGAAIAGFEKWLAMRKGHIDAREVVPAGAPPSGGRFKFLG